MISGLECKTLSVLILLNFFKNSVEDIMIALEKENSEWAKATLTTMKAMSPTSLKVIFLSFTRPLLPLSKATF